MSDLYKCTLFVGNTTTQTSYTAYMKTRNFALSFKHEYENAIDKAVDLYGGSALSKIANTAGEAIAALTDPNKFADTYGVQTPLYKNVKSYKGTTPLEFESGLTFYFKYGMNDAFSGETEVVTPILAIASNFAASPNTTGSALGYNGPALNKKVFTADVIKATINGVKSIATDTKDNEVLGFINSSAITIMNNIGKQVISDNTNKFLFIQFGKMPKLGPFYVKGASVDFDFTNRDSAGFPLEGTLTLTGLTTPTIYSSSDFDALKA